jgi:hypothetical protein
MGRLEMTHMKLVLPPVVTVLAVAIVALVAFGLLGEITMSALDAPLMAFGIPLK